MSKIRWKIGANAYMTINTDGFNSVKVTSVEFSGSGDCYSNNDYWDDGDRTIKYILDYWEDITGQPSPDYMDSYGSGFTGGLPYVETIEKPYQHFELFDYSNVDKIIIPSAITSIGACLLYWNNMFTEIYGIGPRNDCTFDIIIKGNVTRIGYMGICNCTRGNIVFESDVLTRLDYEALSSNYGQINLGQCIINKLSEDAFKECKNVVNINIKEINCIINAGTFSNCYSLKIFSTKQLPDGSGGYKTVNNYISKGINISGMGGGDPFRCCQSLEEITVSDNATIEGDTPSSRKTAFFCFIHSRNEYPDTEVPIWPQYWTKWKPPLPPYVSNPNSDGIQTTKLITNNQTYKNINWEFYGRAVNNDDIWYIAHKGQWLSFRPQEVTDNNYIIMKHKGQYLKYKLVLPSDPKASPVYCKHNNRWMCLAYN